MPDYYKVLMVLREASEAEIKAAYRRLALKFHPDQNAGDGAASERMKQISEAYRVLSDPENRRFYDRFGVQREALVRAGGGLGHGMSELVETFLGDLLKRRRTRKAHGRDRKYMLELHFRDAATGGTKEIEVPAEQVCSHCGGIGAQDIDAMESCHVCEGSGEVRDTRPWVPLRHQCDFCDGRGVVLLSMCGDCEGVGRVEITRSLTIPVPSGVLSGKRFRFPGLGEPGQFGGRNGDLYVQLEVMPDPLLSREDNNVLCVLPITVAEAVLGTVCRVPTIDGPVQFRIPPGTPSGKKFRLTQRGIPHASGRGDQIVEVFIELPNELDSAHRVSLEKWPSPADRAHPHRRRFEDLLADQCALDAPESGAE